MAEIGIPPRARSRWVAVLTQGLTQVLDGRLQPLGITGEGIPPNVLLKLGIGDDLARTPEQIHEQGVLCLGQVQWPAMQHDRAPLMIHHERTGMHEAGDLPAVHKLSKGRAEVVIARPHVGRSDSPWPAPPEHDLLIRYQRKGRQSVPGFFVQMIPVILEVL